MADRPRSGKREVDTRAQISLLDAHMHSFSCLICLLSAVSVKPASDMVGPVAL